MPASLLRAFQFDRRGIIAIMAAVAMPVLLGSLGLGAEVASWYGSKRALQNAADSAAIAAATNATADSYDGEARAVAAKYGFTEGVDGVTVATSNTAPCPDGQNNCYSVTINRVQPILLAQMVGYQGDATMSGQPAKKIFARAVARQGTGPREYCILALAKSGDPEALRTNGAPKADLSGCGVMSNSGATCNGHDLQADYGDAFGMNNGCGKLRHSNVPKASDDYEALKSNIPADNCTSYPKAPPKKKDPPLPASNQLKGIETRNVIPICGDAELTGPLTIAANGPTTLVVYNGSLDLKGFKLQTIGDSELTIVFAGSDNSRTHAPVGDGTYDFKAPTSGPWKGVAMYQDPDISGGVDISAAGNQPTWNITGLTYFPRASVTFSGAVNKASNGKSCFAMVVDNVTINGTGSILSHGQCDEAGVTLPHADVPSRGELVS